MATPELLKVVLLNLIFLSFVRNSFSISPKGIEDLPKLNLLSCIDQEYEQFFQQMINVSNLLHLVYNDHYLYFFFDEFFIKQAIPELYLKASIDYENQNSQAVYLYHPQVAWYKGIQNGHSNFFANPI